MSLPFINFDVSPSSRTSNPTNYPHELCLACSSPYHNAGDCPHWGQFTNFSCGQLNTNFSDQGFESHSNSYTPNRNNHSDVSWFALATRNYMMYKFNCTRQLHESIVVMWLCKCEVEPTENRVCRKPTLKCLN
jgi:hypothetical protein